MNIKKRLISLFLTAAMITSVAVQGAVVVSAETEEEAQSTENNQPAGTLSPDDVYEKIENGEAADVLVLEKEVTPLSNDIVYGTTPEFTGDEWYNKPDVYAVNTIENPSISFIPYESADKAFNGSKDYAKETSNYVQMLTGDKQADWSLVVLQNDDAKKSTDYANFYQTDYQVSADKSWKTNLELPKSWTMQGFDYSIYTNVNMPFQNSSERTDAPNGPTIYNPVGLYRKNFTLDDTVKNADGRILICFQGVESAYYVYVNGKAIGYSENSYDSHYFDITDAVNKDGNNVLAVEVHKFCDGTWFEDQDMIYDGGIFRDVFIVSTPTAYIHDYKVETPLTENYTKASLKLTGIKIQNTASTAKEYTVKVQLKDQDGTVFLAEQEVGSVNVPANNSATLEKTISNLTPKLWSAETPNLYTMILSLYDGSEYVYSMAQQLGFREIGFTRTEVQGTDPETRKASNYNVTTTQYQTITINGQRLYLKGTNRHDTDPFYGKHTPKKTLETDVYLMKANNLNALRTSHYPNDPYIYYLADKYGLYVMAEANVECHHLMSGYLSFGNAGTAEQVEAMFKEAVLQRQADQFASFKNVSSVIMWSIGNESFYTTNAAYADYMYAESIWYYKDRDTTRPVHAEGFANPAKMSVAKLSGGCDVSSEMYPRDIDNNFDNRANLAVPYLMCEYDHAMGNAVGSMDRYWDVTRASDNMLGGFIWDWVDQSRAIDLAKLGMTYQFTEKSSAHKTGTAEVTGKDATANAGNVSGTSINGGITMTGNSEYYNQYLSGANKQFTLEIIMKPTAKSNQVLFAKGDRQVVLKVNASNKIEFFAYNNGWNETTCDLPANWAGSWHQLAVTYNAGAVKIYCDGNEIHSDTVNAAPAATSEEFTVGTQSDMNDRDFKGEILVARGYSKALTKEQIVAQNSSNPAIPATSGDVFFWADFADSLTNGVSSAWDYYSEDYAHQTLYKEEMKEHYFGYGGDWGDWTDQLQFCVNGLVSPDRDPQPEIYEVKYQYQNYWFDAVDFENGTFSVRNESSSIDLNAYDVTWEILKDATKIAEGTITESVAPGTEKTITLGDGYEIPEAEAGSKYYINFSVKTKTDYDWAKAGYEVAYSQLELPVEYADKTAEISSENVTVDQSGEDAITVTGTDFSFSINKNTGAMENYTYKDNVLITTGPTPNLYRASTNNDGASNNGSGRHANWKTATDGVTLSSVNVGQNEDGQNTITTVLALKNNANGGTVTMVYTIDGSGAVTVDYTVDCTSTQLGRYSRIGSQMILPAGYENVTWYGNGPVESYSDRNTFARQGVYDNTVSSMFYPFVDAQDTGNLTGVNWITVKDPEKSSAMLFVGKGQVEASALHFTSQELDADHLYKLNPRDDTVVTVNYGSDGAGNSSCGPDVMNKYQIPNSKPYSYTFTMIPYETTATDDEIMDLSKGYHTVISTEESDDEEGLIPNTEIVEVNACSEHTTGPANNAIDGDEGTYWHTNWQNDVSLADGHHWIEFTFKQAYNINKIKYLPRQDMINGCITTYDIIVTKPNGEQQTVVSDGTWTEDYTLKTATFDTVEAIKVKILVKAAHGDTNGIHATAAEFKFYQEIINSDLVPAPNNFQAVDITETSVKLTWEASSGVVAYQIKDEEGNIIASATASDTSKVIEGLDPGTTYTFTICSIDGSNTESKSASVTFTTLESHVTPTGILGDVNNDGNIDAGDATLMLQRYAGIIGDDYETYDPTLADVNGDGKVNVGDATLVLQKYAGIITAFPETNNE